MLLQGSSKLPGSHLKTTEKVESNSEIVQRELLSRKIPVSVISAGYENLHLSCQRSCYA